MRAWKFGNINIKTFWGLPDIQYYCGILFRYQKNVTYDTKPKMTTKICWFFYPWDLFWQVWYVPHTIWTSNIYFGDSLLIPVILSYIAAGYDHFRTFYQNLKNDHFFQRGGSKKSRFCSYNILTIFYKSEMLRNNFLMMCLKFLQIFFVEKIKNNKFENFGETTNTLFSDFN